MHCRMSTAQTLKSVLEPMYPTRNVIIGRYGGPGANIIPPTHRLPYGSTDAQTLAHLPPPTALCQSIHVDATNPTHVIIEFVR